MCAGPAGGGDFPNCAPVTVTSIWLYAWSICRAIWPTAAARLLGSDIKIILIASGIGRIGTLFDSIHIKKRLPALVQHKYKLMRPGASVRLAARHHVGLVPHDFILVSPAVGLEGKHQAVRDSCPFSGIRSRVGNVEE